NRAPPTCSRWPAAVRAMFANRQDAGTHPVGSHEGFHDGVHRGDVRTYVVDSRPHACDGLDAIGEHSAEPHSGADAAALDRDRDPPKRSLLIEQRLISGGGEAVPGDDGADRVVDV